MNAMIELIASGLAMLSATPQTLFPVLEKAKPGDTVVLAPGNYGMVAIRKMRWERPITIDARQANMVLEMRESSGINFKGGTFGPAPDSVRYAALIANSSHVSFDGSQFVDSQRGLVIGGSHHVNVDNVLLARMRVDGMNIASSQFVTVRNSRCEEFDTGKAHPDCVQLWSRPHSGITSDITIENNVSIGNMQGFTAFNHVRDGVDDGGFDRVIIRNNVVKGLYPQGVALYDCRNCIVENNETSRLPGARWKVNVNVYRCTDCTVRKNKVGS